MSERLSRESRDTWFFRKHGCLPGCAGPLALLLVAFACLLLDSANRDQALGDAVGAGKLPSFTSTLTAEASLGDSPYLLPGPYAYLKREPETYAWSEWTSQTDEGQSDGDDSRIVKTTITYTKGWTTSPSDSNRFKQPRGHGNPRGLEPRTDWAERVTLGGRRLVGRIDVRGEPFLPKPSQLGSGARVEGQYVYVGRGTLDTPKVGDVRVRYSVLRVGQEATFFGNVLTETLETYPGTNGPSAALRAGTAAVASQRVYVDLGLDAFHSRVWALILACIGIYIALSALVIWTQRSSSRSFRKGVYALLGFVTGWGTLAFLACVDVVLRLGAPPELVSLGAVLATAVGFFVFGRWARAAHEAVKESFWLRLLLGDVSDDAEAD
jgi:hypothetical protein